MFDIKHLTAARRGFTLETGQAPNRLRTTKENKLSLAIMAAEVMRYRDLVQRLENGEVDIESHPLCVFGMTVLIADDPDDDCAFSVFRE